eukprot:122129_1
MAGTKWRDNTDELDAERIGGIIYKHALFRSFTRGQLHKHGQELLLNNPSASSSSYLAMFANTKYDEIYYYLLYDDHCGTDRAEYSLVNISAKYIHLMPSGSWFALGMKRGAFVQLQSFGIAKQAYEHWMHTQNISFPWDSKPKTRKDCEHCGASNAYGIILKKCSGCKRTYYCSKYCQKRSWKESHRIKCLNL